MKWWPGWDLRKSPFDEGQICDPRSYAGIIRGAVFFSFCIWGLWHMDDSDVAAGRMTVREQEWHHLLTIGMAIFGYVCSLVSVIYVFLQRRKLRKINKNIKDQWYETQALTKQDLLEYGEPEHEERGGLSVKHDSPGSR